MNILEIEIRKDTNAFFYTLIGAGFLLAYIQICLQISILFIPAAAILFAIGISGLSDDGFTSKKFINWLLLFVLCFLGKSLITLFEQDDQSFSVFASLLKSDLVLAWQGQTILWIFIPVLLYSLLSFLSDKKGLFTFICLFCTGAGLLFFLKGIFLPLCLGFVLTATIGVMIGNALKGRIQVYPLLAYRIGKHVLLYALAFSFSEIFEMAFSFGGPAVSMILRLVTVVFSGEVLAYLHYLFGNEEKEESRFYQALRIITARHKKLYERIFYILFGIVFTFLFYRSTTFERVVEDAGYGRLTTLITEFAGLFLLFYAGFSLVLDENRKAVGFKFFVLLTTQIIWHTTHALDMAMMCISMIAASGKSAKALAREASIISFLLMMSAMICAKAGLIANVISPPMKQALGIIYYTDSMAHWSFLYMLSFIAWPRRMTWYRALLYLGLIQLLYHFTCARTGYFCMVLYTALAFGVDLFFHDRNQLFNHKKLVNLCYGTFIIGALVSYTLVWTFGQAVDGESLIGGTWLARWQLGNLALRFYPIHLFGTYIIEIGAGGVGEVGPDLPYFFIDCSYVRLLSMNGIIFFVLMLVMMTLLVHRSIKEKNAGILLMCIIVAIQCISEHHMTEMTYNLLPVLLFMEYDFPQLKQSVVKTELLQ